MERLEDETHAGASQSGAPGIIERGEVLPGDDDAARVRHVEPGDEIEERGLAGAGLAHHGDVLAGGEVQRHVVQHDARARARRKIY